MQRDAFFAHLSFNCGFVFFFFFFFLSLLFLKITSSETGEQERRSGEKVTFVYTY